MLIFKRNNQRCIPDGLCITKTINAIGNKKNDTIEMSDSFPYQESIDVWSSKLKLYLAFELSVLDSINLSWTFLSSILSHFSFQNMKNKMCQN